MTIIQPTKPADITPDKWTSEIWHYILKFLQPLDASFLFYSAINGAESLDANRKQEALNAAKVWRWRRVFPPTRVYCEPSQTQTRHAAVGPPAQPRTWRRPRVRIAQRAPWRLHGRVCARPRPPEATRTQSGVCAPPPRQRQKTPALLTVSGGWGRRRSSARYIITPLTSAKHRKDPV